MSCSQDLICIFASQPTERTNEEELGTSARLLVNLGLNTADLVDDTSVERARKLENNKLSPALDEAGLC